MTTFFDVAEALAGEVITFSPGVGAPSIAVRAWGLHEVPDVPQSGDLPRRLILPPGANGVPAFASIEYVTSARAKVAVQVVDLLLWQTVGTAPNLQAVWPALAFYCDAYMRQLLALRFMAEGMVTNVTPSTAVYEWPQKSNRFYHGAQIVVRVEGWLCVN